MNITTADIAIDLSTVFENVDGRCYSGRRTDLIKGDPQAAYEEDPSSAM